MPYPLPQQPSTVGGQRVRLLPPVGCSGVEQWVLPMEFSRWAELGYRKGPIPADDLELFWLPADSLERTDRLGGDRAADQPAADHPLTDLGDLGRRQQQRRALAGGLQAGPAAAARLRPTG